jgi:phenylalanyl-tRNA synthetase beta chain
MLGTLKYNINRDNRNVSIFEIARVYRKSGKKLPEEPVKLGILLSGNARLKAWMEEERKSDIYDVKGILEGIFEDIYANPEIRVMEKEYRFFHPQISSDFKVNKVKMGIMGKLHPGITEDMEIGQDVFYAEIDLDRFNANIDSIRKYETISPYPSMDIDLAIVVDKTVKNEDLVESIRNSAGPLLKDIRLFDIYEGRQIEKGKKSMAYSLRFRREDRTLKDREVEITVNRIVEDLEKRYKASLRS